MATLVVLMVALCGRASAESIGFAVSAQLPDNQLGGAGYFYLNVEPAAQQLLVLAVLNRIDTELTVNVQLRISDRDPLAAGAAAVGRNDFEFIIIDLRPFLVRVSKEEEKPQGIELPEF